MEQLLNKLYHLLWCILPKKQLQFGDRTIQYLILPAILLVGGKEAKIRLGGSMCIVHRPSKTMMILISSIEPREERRYTVYHEFIEGSCMLRIGIADTAEGLVDCLKESRSILGGDFGMLENKLASYAKETKDWPHVVALIMELALVKQEMPQAQYKHYLDNALTHRA
jgi:hypothetical protein